MSAVTHQDEQEAYNAGWNASRWGEPRNCPYYDRDRRREYVAGYNDAKEYRAHLAKAQGETQ